MSDNNETERRQEEEGHDENVDEGESLGGEDNHSSEEEEWEHDQDDVDTEQEYEESYPNEIQDSFVEQCNEIRENRTDDYVALLVTSSKESVLAGEALHGNSSIREFRFRNIGGRTHSMQGIYRFVGSSSLWMLDIHETTPRACIGFLRAVKHNVSIRSLALVIHSSIIVSLVDLLESSVTLQHLTILALGDTLSPQQRTSLASAIAAPTSSLRELSLSTDGDDDDRDDTMKALILDRLPADHPLEAIHLDGGLRHSCIALRHLLERTRNLKKVGFSPSDPNSAWVEVIQGLRNNHTVRSLDVKYLYMHHDVTVLLQDFVRSARNITDLAIREVNEFSEGNHDNALEEAFWRGMCQAIVENQSITRLSLEDPFRHPRILSMITQCTRLQKLDLHWGQESGSPGFAEVIGTLPVLKELYLRAPLSTDRPRVDMRPLVAALARSLSLQSLKLADKFLLVDQNGAQVLADHLSSDLCALKHLEVNWHLDLQPLKILVGALQVNHTLESLIIWRECVGSGDIAWMDVLVHSLEVNQTLKHIKISSLDVERDLGGIVSFFCLRNKYRPLTQSLPPSVLVKSLLRHHLGPSVLFHFMKQGQLEVNSFLSRKRGAPPARDC